MKSIIMTAEDRIIKRIRNFRNIFFSDPRDIQILFLSSFLLLGVRERDFTLTLSGTMAAIGITLLAQFFANRVFKVSHPSLRSAWITALSLILLLRVNSWMTMAIAGIASILSKFVFRSRGKHFFNPSNFGIIFVLLLTGDAWVTPGQWGDDLWLAFLFIGTGAMIVGKVGRIDTTGAFLLAYGLLEAVRNVWLGWTWDVYLHRMTSGALLLFAFFMITDPRVIANRRIARIVWSVAVAVLAFILRNSFFVTAAVFWALFVLSPWTLLLDRVWPAGRFEWKSAESRKEAYSKAPLAVSEVST